VWTSLIYLQQHSYLAYLLFFLDLLFLLAKYTANGTPTPIPVIANIPGILSVKELVADLIELSTVVKVFLASSATPLTLVIVSFNPGITPLRTSLTAVLALSTRRRVSSPTLFTYLSTSAIVVLRTGVTYSKESLTASVAL
jgi:hypothetical protein